MEEFEKFVIVDRIGEEVEFRSLERIEQATAAPGEVRNVEVPYAKRCWRLTGEGQERCHLQMGHAGECSSAVHVSDSDAGHGLDNRG